ncbi:MAG: general secretion pathway protein GspB [Candidatus Omnitrophota bacterium]|nr:MAG: general secretion pathway protein GspB [Candidatus Omnitrophota bacterium]
MISKKIITFCFFSLGLLWLFLLEGNVYAQTEYRDPFEARFPEKPEEVKKVEIKEPVGVSLPAMTINGILYAERGTSNVIINGQVYRIGEVIEGTTIKIHKIEKNKIFVLYQGGLFEVGIISKDIGKKEKK